jgi:hypothetical protein
LRPHDSFTLDEVKIDVCGQQVSSGKSSGQVHISSERDQNDQGNICQTFPGTSVCQIHQSWEQYNYELGCLLTNIYWRILRAKSLNIMGVTSNLSSVETTGRDSVNWIHLAQDGDKWRPVVNTVMNLRVKRNAGNILMRNYWLVRDCEAWCLLVG